MKRSGVLSLRTPDVLPAVRPSGGPRSAPPLRCVQTTERALVRAGVITASDRSSRGERADASGPALAALLARIPARPAGLRVVPDTVRDIRGALRAFLRDPEVKLILTTGGTGVTPRDVTPEATAPLIERPLPGLALAMRWGSYRHTPFALVSRALAGFHGDCLIVNLPGSPRAVEECFAILLPTLRWLFGGGAAEETRTTPRRERWP